MCYNIKLAHKLIKRMIKFCPQDGCMIDKTNEEVEGDIWKEDDEL